MKKFSFELSSVISEIFVADFEHVFVCWERYRQKVESSNDIAIIANN